MLSLEKLFLGGWISAHGPCWSSRFLEKHFSMLTLSPVSSALEMHVQGDWVDAWCAASHTVVPPPGRPDTRRFGEGGGPGCGEMAAWSHCCVVPGPPRVFQAVILLSCSVFLKTER